MSAARPHLTLDDPLSTPVATAPVATVATVDPPAPAPAPAPPVAQRRRPRPAAPRPRTDATPQGTTSAPAGEWRDWSGASRVASFRLPDEILIELTERTTRLGLPIGQTVLAAITALLDSDDETLLAQIDRAAQALTRGKRRARQQRSTT